VVDEDIGQHIPKGRTYLASEYGEFTMPDQPATFEQMPYILACGVKAVTAGVADGTGSGMIYEYPQPVTGGNSIKAASIEAGDNVAVDEITYGTVEEWTLSGATKDVIKVSAKWFGRTNVDGSFTAALTAPAVEDMVFAGTKLFLDNSGGQPGSTQVSGSFLAFKVDWKTGWKGVFTGDGNAYFTEVEYQGAEITGSWTLRNDALGKAERELARAGTIRLAKLLIEGSALQAAGTVYSKKSVVFQGAIQYDNVPDWSDSDGRVTVQLPWHVVDSDDIVPTVTVVIPAVSL